MPFREIEHIQEGCQAFRSGVPRTSNPHKRWSAAWVAWLIGWDHCAEEKDRDVDENSLSYSVRIALTAP
jgi:hypothetical protein